MVFFVEDTQIERQHNDDEDDENDEKQVSGNHFWFSLKLQKYY